MSGKKIIFLEYYLFSTQRKLKAKFINVVSMEYYSLYLGGAQAPTHFF
jgi:hypothetical protein